MYIWKTKVIVTVQKKEGENDTDILQRDIDVRIKFLFFKICGTKWFNYGGDDFLISAHGICVHYWENRTEYFKVWTLCLCKV